jgi:HEPN domain-containing protein
MNRLQLQALSKTRLAEAKALLKLDHYSGAYYLAGYAVECALKAIIARGTARHDFPDKKRVDDSYKHDLKVLVRVAEMEASLIETSSRDRIFSENWDLVIRWSEQARYSQWERVAAEALLQAISQKQHGVMAWLIQHW